MIPPIVCSFEPVPTLPASQPEPVEPFEISSAMHNRAPSVRDWHARVSHGRMNDEHIALSGTEAAAVRWSAPNKQASKEASKLKPKFLTFRANCESEREDCAAAAAAAAPSVRVSVDVDEKEEMMVTRPTLWNCTSNDDPTHCK